MFRTPWHHRSRATAFLAAAAVVASTVTTAALTTSASAADATILSASFADDSWQTDWEQDGGPALSRVDVDGDPALQVAGRTADYDGIQTKSGVAAAKLLPGVTYTLSMKARLAAGTAGSAGVRFVVKDDAYNWVGNTTMTADAWATVTGTYTAPASPPSDFKVYIGTGDVTGGGVYTYLIDDVLVTGPGAEGPTAVVSNGFEDAITPWRARNSTVAATTAEARTGAKSLLVSARGANWAGAEADLSGVLLDGEQYEISAWVKLPAGTEGTSGIKVTAQTVTGETTSYAGITNLATVGADEWAQLTGTFTRTPGMTSVVLYFEAADIGAAHPDFLVDDVEITGQAGGDGDYVESDPNFVPGGAVNATQTPVTAARGTAKTSALTFDDGPNGATTLELLDFLKANGVHATFCVIGQNITAGTGDTSGATVLRRIVADGHTLCNHSTDYAGMEGLSKAQAAAKMKQNLATIRAALNDPFAEVPYFRAPNGTWGDTLQPAVALGMQPLAVANLVNDWDGAENAGDEAKLTAALRATITGHPGEIVLVHDGGGDRTAGVAAVKTVVAELLADGWTFTLPAGGAVEKGKTVLSSDFEDGTLQGWASRDLGDPNGAATLEVADEGHESAHSARTADRLSQGHGPQYDVTALMVPGASYDVEAWVKFEGAPGDMTLSAHTVNDGTDNYSNLVQFTGLSSSQWVKLTGTFTMPAFDTAAQLYFETKWASGDAGNTSTFLIDDIVVKTTPPAVIQDLTPLHSTVDFPVGAAIDDRETAGSASQLLLRHFNQVTSENYMKPEAWYDGDKQFRRHPQATALMDFAQANDLRVYGHVLVWHSQTPDWFFQDGGRDLTNSPADQAILRERLRQHIHDVAANLAGTYGEFGSATNPLVAFDVVNEVVDDGTAYSDGLRRSKWYQILGEQFIDLAFEYADDEFNGEFAADGSVRPVKLFINDYNTEQSGKRGRYHALVERLLARDVPVDGVGHQFHVALSTPVSTLGDALTAFEDLPVTQAVTELDVQVGSADQAKAIDQGYYYRDAFAAFRAHSADLYSVTLWGLTDGRSWRASNNGKPLLFDDFLQAKPAFYGAAGLELPAAVRSANAFRADAGADYAAGSLEWRKLPLIGVGEHARFQLRWAPDTLTVFVDVDDSTKQPATDAVVLATPAGEVTLRRDGTGTLPGTVAERAGGWTAVARLPLSSAAQGGSTQLDVRTVDGATTSAWNTPGVLGAVAFVEPLSFLQVTQATSAPTIDGAVDAVWSDAGSVRTAKDTTGSGGAQAVVKTLWRDNMLYVLADVADPVVDTTGSDPWTKDSVEFYVDPGNAKNGSYRYDDTQIRINANNEVSFGTGDEAFQRGRLTSAVVRTATGYRVEAAISLLEYGGQGTFHGLDFQVNDAANGARSAITNWADPTNAGYQSTAHWGVGQLVGPASHDVAPKVTTQPKSVTVANGGSATYTAKASGSPAPRVQWQVRPTPRGAWANVRGGTATTLKVVAGRGTDGAAYRAVFTNSAGTVTSSAATLTVQKVKPRVVKQPTRVRAAAYRTVTVTVRVSGYPAPTVQWYEKREGWSRWVALPRARTTSVTLLATPARDNAQYRMVATNAAGVVTSKVIRLDVAGRGGPR